MGNHFSYRSKNNTRTNQIKNIQMRKALTKEDLIAIAIALDPEMKSQIHDLQSKSVYDLNVIVRLNVYKPHRFAESTDQDLDIDLDLDMEIVN